MTPEQEEALLLQMKAMQTKLDSYETEKTDAIKIKLDSMRGEMVSLTGEKLDSFKDWDEKSLTSSIAVLKKNTKVEEDVPSADELIPKLDSNGKEIPYSQRINWTKVNYPPWV